MQEGEIGPVVGRKRIVRKIAKDAAPARKGIRKNIGSAGENEKLVFDRRDHGSREDDGLQNPQGRIAG